ncbi:hypothetical protein SFC08_14900 [Lysinibacillus halotolerans]|uniref:hypothetical protein n=1 Tax=Ureibacillus sp. FSL E2-3493 TaxID=2921367 RepID=UPI00311A0922
MNTFLLILLFAAISFLDYRHLMRTKDKKGFIVYTSILALAFVITQLHLLGFKVPGLNKFVTFIVNLFI